MTNEHNIGNTRLDASKMATAPVGISSGTVGSHADDVDLGRCHAAAIR
ncbi:hypothetical protein [Arthrobacter sp. MA-N2]|nr:hypothetical protein [Arthrobacter sp. MA-N2]